MKMFLQKPHFIIIRTLALLNVPKNFKNMTARGFKVNACHDLSLSLRLSTAVANFVGDGFDVEALCSIISIPKQQMQRSHKIYG